MAQSAFKMVLSACNCLLLFIVVSSGFCQQDFPENGNATEGKLQTLVGEEANGISQPPKSAVKATSAPDHHNNPSPRLKHADNKQHSVGPRRQRPPPKRNNPLTFGLHNFEETEPIANAGGRYNLRLHDYRSQSPPDFNAALGVISAHIADQKPEEEYIPYPPNGDPYNYPPYRVYPHVAEPPVIRAYEAASNNDFGSQSTANFNQFDSRIFHNNNGYDFPNRYDNSGINFYNDRNFFQGEGGEFKFTARNMEPGEELRSLFQGRELHYGRPLKRVETV